MSNTKQIEHLKQLIKKRDELIYSMMFSLSFNYQMFMRNESIDIDELRKRFNTEKHVTKKVAQHRISLLGKDINEN